MDYEASAHGVSYHEMRTGFQIKPLDKEEKKATKKLLKKLERKSLDMILSEVRYLKQRMRNERRAAKARSEPWQQVFE